MEVSTKEIENFIDNYAPGNHWLSKSMELSRNKGKGTYWYLKKYTVFYYYVFVLKKLDKVGLSQIVNIFNDFCDSVHPKAKQKCLDFFFGVDIRKIDSIITLDEFAFKAGMPEDDPQKILARKFYFCYLMNIDEQHPNKKVILGETINHRNYFSGIAAARQKLGNYSGFETHINDVPAFLRNERQVLFLQGLLNVPHTFICEEFMPTDFGRQVIYANFNEMILLMEIQKLKQISRNPLTFYDNSTERPRNRSVRSGVDKNIIKKGRINSHPYFLILNYLKTHGSINANDYRFLLARTSDLHNPIEIIGVKKNMMDEVKRIVDAKDREYIQPGNNAKANDPVIKPEDFSKEFKKYIQGVFSVGLDIGANLFCVGVESARNYLVKDKPKLDKLIDGYASIIDQLDTQYANVFGKADVLQNDKYAHFINRVKFNEKSAEVLEMLEAWLNYFATTDVNIIKTMLMAVANANGISKEQILEVFPNICKRTLKINSKKEISKLIEFTAGQDTDEYIPIHVPGKVSIEMLELESQKYLQYKNDFRNERKRNMSLIDQYSTYKSQNNMRCCEVCGKELTRKKDGIDIVCFHHILPFNEAGALGPDHYKNIIGVCPDCHSKFHANLPCLERKSLYNLIGAKSLLKMTVIERVLQLYVSGFLYNATLEYAVVKGMISEQERVNIIRRK